MTPKPPRVLTFLAILILAGGCSISVKSNSTEYLPIPDIDIPYTSVWSSEADIDLFSRGAELVRAAMEAGNHTSSYSIAMTFPGYAEAITPLDGYESPKLPHTYRAGNIDNSRIDGATYFFHIAELSETPTEVTAEVCDDFDLTETTVSSNVRRHGFSWVVTLQNTTDIAGPPGIADADPASPDPRAHSIPDWNVFGTWKITRLITGGIHEHADVAHPACTKWWQQRHPGTFRIIDGYAISPAGEVPGRPVAVQYPEWIGPEHTE